MSRAEIEALAAAFGKAFTNQDAAEVASFYAEDAKLLAPNAPVIQGRAGIEDFVREMFSMGARSLELESVDVLPAGDLIVEVGRYHLQMQPPDGELMTDVGKYIGVHRRQQDGSLKLVADTFNSDLPVPGAA